ncbi:MAG: hypothetical protein HYY25_12695 [Candidatus Wallbacteria bacterium]|nr:hypothetical protein [Candidatus Wallbacteria bacterium]
MLGLVILAVGTGAIQAASTGEDLVLDQVGWMVAKAAIFLVGGLGIGMLLSARFFLLASYLHGHGVLLAASLAVCLSLSWAVAQVGMAPLVGAYAAGLILEEVHFRRLSDGADRGASGADLLRDDGDAGGSHRVRKSTGPLAGLAVHGRRHRGKAGVRARRARNEPERVLYRHLYDLRRRSRPRLHKHRHVAVTRRQAGHRRHDPYPRSSSWSS